MIYYARYFQQRMFQMNQSQIRSHKDQGGQKQWSLALQDLLASSWPLAALLKENKILKQLNNKFKKII